MAPTELELSDEIKWIKKERIQDNMDDFFRHFDDSMHNPPRMNSQIWFHRQNKTPCQPCGEEYVPHCDRQRYCYSCQTWIHTRCLDGENAYPDFDIPPNQGVLDVATLGGDGLPSVFGEVLSRPTVRGHGGEFLFADCWLNTGSGVQKALIEEWKAGTLPGDWLKQLGENFLEEFVIGKSWRWYSCCLCSSRM